MELTVPAAPREARGRDKKMKTPEQKAAKKAHDRAKKAAAFARNNSTVTPVPEFAPPCTTAEFFAPLFSSEAAFRAKINR